MSHSHEEVSGPGRLVSGTRPALDSASTLLLRDRDGALEVFMLERHIETDFAGGALVFPGGKVEAGDRQLPRSRWRGLEPDRAQARLGAASPSDALGLAVAAVRETFEEAGVLLGWRGRRPIAAEDLDTPSFRDARARLSDRMSHWDWGEWLASEDVVLDLGALTLWSWWATPDGLHRRYDTRFFVAPVPPGQERVLAHDDIETVSSRWTTPADALSAQAAGAVTIVYPTRQNLRQLAAFTATAEACRAARSAVVRRLKPTLVRVDGQPMVLHPDGGSPEVG